MNTINGSKLVTLQNNSINSDNYIKYPSQNKETLDNFSSVLDAFKSHVPEVKEEVPSLSGNMPNVTENGVSSIKSDPKSAQEVNTASGIEAFSSALKDAIAVVNEVQVGADQTSKDFATGKKMQIHEAMLAMEKASITLKFLGSVRNRMLEAYQEIMRMNV